MRRLMGLFVALLLGSASAAAATAEYNPIQPHPIALGPEMHRVIVGFRATTNNSIVQTIKPRATAQSVKVVMARTTAADVSGLAARVKLSMTKSRQLTPSMHVMFLKETLYGADVVTALAKLRADPTVEFADVDKIRYPLTITTPNDPLFVATSGATGQWYMQTPSPTGDVSATDAVSAWSLTTGSTGTVIADIDTGVRFDHPDLLRAGFGGRLLPGYDFVGQDYDPKTGNPLGTYLMANDGDGWDPDPSDPGDWINTTDQQSALFPSSHCPTQDSSWHGTRVMGILGALTNNDAGIAGMTWSSWILPVRALGKCGGYDSDIITAVEWAAGLPVSTSATPVPDNPYPANVINLSLGGSDSCPTSYQTALSRVTSLGVLVVASAGNASGSVETPANCSATVSGLIAVAGLRNVGTKVGYSSFGPEVGISAPAGNCVQTSGGCLRSIDTTTNLGTTVPDVNSYTNQTITNLGTSFSAPIVSGIAGLMRSVNGNLTPALLVKRLEASATPFPANTGGLPVCPSLDSNSQCSCPPSGECGTGMVNALSAVNAALNPIAAVSFPPSYTAGSQITFNASSSAAACGRTMASYSWTAGSGVTIISGASSASVIATGSGTLTLRVTDSQGSTDTATITMGATSATSTAPTSLSGTACPKSIPVNPTAPTISQAFSPSSVGVTVTSTMTITLSNTNAFALTQSSLTTTLANGLTVATSPAASTTCTGAAMSLVASGNNVSLTNAIVPANGSCTVTLPVSSTTVGNYTNTIAAGALSTGPAANNTAAAPDASLSVTAPIAPTITQSFSPSNVGENTQSTLTITLSNSNTYALTQAALTDTLPSNLTIATSPAATSSCAGSLSVASGVATLTGASIQASGSCTITIVVSSGSMGTYTNTIAASALTDAQNATNAASSSSLTVTAPKSGGGSFAWVDLLVIAGALATRRRWQPSDQRPS